MATENFGALYTLPNKNPPVHFPGSAPGYGLGEEGVVWEEYYGLVLFGKGGCELNHSLNSNWNRFPSLALEEDLGRTNSH